MRVFPQRRRVAESLDLCCYFSASQRLCGRWHSSSRRGVAVSPRRGGRDGKRMSGASFPQRRRVAESLDLCCYFSASLRLCGRWHSSLRRGVAVSPWRCGPRWEEDEWGEFSRRGAEAQRVLLCVWFSQRLSVSAGDGFRHCVVELLFHRGVVGRDGTRMSGASFPQRRRVAESFALFVVFSEIGRAHV